MDETFYFWNSTINKYVNHGSLLFNFLKNMDISVNRAFTLHATIPFSTSATSNGPLSTPYIIPVLGASSNPWTPQVWPKDKMKQNFENQ